MTDKRRGRKNSPNTRGKGKQQGKGASPRGRSTSTRKTTGSASRPRKPGKAGPPPSKSSSEKKPIRRYKKLEGKEKPRRRTTTVRQETGEMRLNKYLAHAGIAARRKADELIETGQITVNGKKVTELGTKIDTGTDEVRYEGNIVSLEPQLVYIILNKPKDCITTVEDERDRNTVLDLIEVRERVYPVGRLDRDTTGVLLLTNDGDLAYQLSHPRFEVPKVYRAELDKKIPMADIRHLRGGIRLSDGMTRECDAEILDKRSGKVVGIAIHEGKNRQVRRMFEALGYGVKKLDRVAYAGLTCGGLQRGAWRYLEEHEVGALKKFVRENAK